jgi:hypothetical protein
VEFSAGLGNADVIRREEAGERMKSNVVPISRARSGVRRAPVPARLRPVAIRKVAVGNHEKIRRSPLGIASVPATPMWLSILALVAMTMWPSALVWMVQLAYRLAAH